MQRLQQQSGKDAMAEALAFRVGLFAGGQQSHAFANHAGAGLQCSIFADSAGLAAIQDDDLVLDVRGPGSPGQYVAQADTIAGIACILGQQQPLSDIAVELAMPGKVQQCGIALSVKQFLDMPFQ
ncbi:hypothetical protein D3C81_1713690 [compost metagenome]